MSGDHDLRLGYEFLNSSCCFFNALTTSIVAGCWASSGYNIAGCAALEQQLRACMDTPVCVQSASLGWKPWREALGGAARDHGYGC